MTKENFLKELTDDFVPVHINYVRNETHFWNWSSDLKGWVRGREIPYKLKRDYKNPLAGDIY